MNLAKVLIVVVLGTGTFAWSQKSQKNRGHIEAMAGAYYTGCMGGIVATIQEDLFKEGKTKDQALSNFNRLKVNCKKQQADYKEFLGE
jgi:hypothetical protein